MARPATSHHKYSSLERDPVDRQHRGGTEADQRGVARGKVEDGRHLGTTLGRQMDALSAVPQSS